MTKTRRGGLWLPVLTSAALALSSIVLTSAASAALPSNCTQTGGTVTCTFAYTGAEQSLAVPAGVTSVQVDAVGGTGGVDGTDDDSFGGYGATVSATVPTAGASTLYVEVGGNGSSTGAGGLSGSQASGGAGGVYTESYDISGGGGGASVVQKCSSADSSCLARYYGTSDPRLVVAAGGGGGGGYDGCNGGSGGGGVGPNPPGYCSEGGGGGNGTGGSGQEITCEATNYTNGGGGGATPTAAGAGGNSDTGLTGQPGSGPLGGAGYPGANPDTGFGGGGGGGYYGGGGGGATTNCDQYGFGGGAGSSYAAGTSVTYGNDTTATPSVTISYTVPASVATGPAKKVTESSATLTGTVNPNGSATSYYFQYGTSKRYGQKTAEISAGSGTSTESEAAAISGLTAGTTYHFRIVAVNSGETSYGADRSFKTAARPLKLSVSPTRVQAGTRTCFVIRATSAGRPVSGAKVHLAGQAARTSHSGRATLCVTLTKGGHRVSATKRGYHTASATITATAPASFTG